VPQSSQKFTPVALLAAGAYLSLALSASAATDDRLEIGNTQSGNYLSALIASADRDSDAASLYFREALRGDPRNLVLLERSFASAIADGDADDGFSLADRLIARDPGNSLARLATATRAILGGQWASARAQLTYGDAGKARDVTTSLLVAWTWAGTGDLKHALDTIDRISDPSLQVFKDYHAGLIADALGNPIEARRRLKLAYEGDKNTLRLADAYARFLARHNDVEGAKAIYTDFGKLIPNHPIIVAALADLNAGKPVTAAVPNARDGAAEALYGLGGANSTRQGDELASLIYLRLALMLRPDHDLAAVTVANLLTDMKQPEAAIAAYDSVPKSSAMRESSDIQVAMILDEESKSADALKRMNAIVAEHPDDPDVWSSLGSLQRSAKNFAGAQQSYDKAISLIPHPDKSRWTLYYFRGICFERNKDWPKAEADFKTAL
jgi:tetratricopeptide (TPR) repeat protein